MITGFEEITKELSKHEKEVVFPAIYEILRDRLGKENTITNKQIISKLSQEGITTTASRVRKTINYFRTKDTIRLLIATNRGYYISNSLEELTCYINSLEERINAIRVVKESLIRQREKAYGDTKGESTR